MRVYVVALIGIPASGKSSLSKIILDLSRRKSFSANVVLICFDKLLKIDFASMADGDYKRKREELFIKLENLVANFVTNFYCLSDEIPPDDIHTSAENSSTLFILDDNMYFRSMRQRARQLCKNCGCDYFQIFMRTLLKNAIERNSQRRRSERVDKSTIEKMFNDLEIPLNPRTIVLELSSIDENNLIAQLNDRIAQPEVLVAEEPPKIPQNQSEIHEMDLMSRRELAVKIQSVKLKENFSKLSFELNEKRKKFMNDIRSEKIKFSNLEDFKIALKNLFDEN